MLQQYITSLFLTLYLRQHIISFMVNPEDKKQFPKLEIKLGSNTKVVFLGQVRAVSYINRRDFNGFSTDANPRV